MMNWAPADLSAQEIYDSLKNVNPNSVVIFNQHIQDGSELRYFPTDVINGEMMPPPTAGHQSIREVNGTRVLLPFEFEPCSQSRAGGPDGIYRNYTWFTYGAGKRFTASRPFPVRLLYKHIKQARDRGAHNVLLACAPDYTGRLRRQDVRTSPPRPCSQGNHHQRKLPVRVSRRSRRGMCAFNILEATDVPTIREVQLFHPKK